MIKHADCSEVLEMALRIKRAVYEFYRTLAAISIDPRLSDIYNRLAEEEQKLSQSFYPMLKSLEKIDVAKIENWNELCQCFGVLLDVNVLAGSPEKNALIQELKDKIGAIQISISFEKDTILFLQEMRRWVSAEEQTKIDKLIDEERNHILKLLNLKQQIALP